MPDAIVVGSGPNGLAAAITLAQAGLSVQVWEGAACAGGGTRTAELTLPGYHHDVCSAVHPLGLGSPFLRTLPLERHGLQWIHPPSPLAHPLDGGQAVVLQRSVEATAASLGPDGPAYIKLMGPLARDWDRIDREILGPFPLFPRHPISLARFGLVAMRSARGLLESRFQNPQARALLGGIAAHSVLPLDRLPSMAAGLVLGALAHRWGWPLPRGGAQSLARALVAHLESLGGEVICNRPVTRLPRAPLVLLDLTPRQFLSLDGVQLPWWYRWQLQRFRYGPGVFKVDYALAAPVPWQAPQVAQAATVHLGGSLEEMARSERDAWEGRHCPRPYLLVAQPSLFDPSRAPEGRHTLWAYCHVPAGSTRDMLGAVEAQIERFAPGFGSLVLARSVWDPARLQAYNPNYVGGDIGGGALTLGQLFTRPVCSLTPYATPLRGVYLCSSSTPPGGGVHGMCGYHAARLALRRL